MCLFFLMIRRPPRSTLFPTRRSSDLASSRLVLPDRYGPTRATQRGALGIDSSTKSGQGRRGLAALSLDRIVARPSGGGNRNLESGPHRFRSSSAVTVTEANHNKAVVPAKAGIHFSVSRARIGGSRPLPGRRTLNYSRAPQARAMR